MRTPHWRLNLPLPRTLAFVGSPSWSRPRAFFLPRSGVRSSASGRGGARQQALREDLMSAPEPADRIAQMAAAGPRAPAAAAAAETMAACRRRWSRCCSAHCGRRVEVTWRVSAFAAADSDYPGRFLVALSSSRHSAPVLERSFASIAAEMLRRRAAARSAPAGPRGDVPRARHHGRAPIVRVRLGALDRAGAGVLIVAIALN